MSDPEVHIAGWEAAGVIDAPTAARLRAASTGPGAAASVAMTSERSNGPGGAQGKPTSAGSFFGPSLVIGELFAYLGVAFLLGAWLVFLSTFGESQYREAVIAGGQALAAIGLIAIGWFLRAGDDRRRRAAGIAFAAATILAAGCAAYVVQMDFLRNTLQGQAPAVLIAAVALVAAVVLRLVLPAVATQFSMVLSIAALAGASLSWLMQFAYPSDQFGHGGVTLNPVPIPPEPIWLVFAGAAFWLIVALGLGVLGALEARNAERDSGAARRAAITRSLAGVLAVVGTASALSQTGAISGDAYGRLIDPWVADLVVLVIAFGLLERAVTRDASAFVLAGAIGLIVAFTDLNFSYLAQTPYVGLLIEGVILLGVGFAGDRLRRRVVRASP